MASNIENNESSLLFFVLKRRFEVAEWRTVSLFGWESEIWLKTAF